MSSILLFIIALLGPWAVHLAPPRQRPVALVCVVAILLLFGIFAGNPLSQWQLWVGLLAGILSILGVAAMRGGGGSPRSRPRSRRRARDDAHSEITGEM
jgi:peptidoglycan/LPS O-acetylase OafA/YrhL